MSMALSSERPDRYYLTSTQRHALWQNELAMFVVLAMPLVLAAFWYGSTIEVIDYLGRVAVPSSFNRGIGLALLVTFVISLAGTTYLYVQPAADRVRNAQPVRGKRRLAFAGFVGLLVAINTAQSLLDARASAEILIYVVAIGLGIVATLIAFAAMLSMIDIPAEPSPLSAESDWVRGAR